MNIEQVTKQLGPENPKSHFSELAKIGMAQMHEIRHRIAEETGDAKKRGVKTWGAQHAAKMIGRTTPWLRKHDPDAPRNESGHGRWTLERINSLRVKAGTLISRPKGASPLAIAFAKLKGGTGNTTNCAHGAHYFAMQGLRVLVLDWDPQGSCTQLIGGFNPDSDIEAEDLPNEALLSDFEGLKYCIKKTYFHNVHLIPANQMLQDLEIDLYGQMEADDESLPPVHERLKLALEPIKELYDVILIDCPPSQGLLTMNALGAADAVVNPIRPALLDRASFVMYTRSLTGFYDFNPAIDLKYHRILISQYSDVVGSREQSDKIREQYGDFVMANKVVDCQEVRNAASKLSTVYALDKPVGGKRTYDRAIESFDSVFGEMLNDIRNIWTDEAA